MRDLNKLLDEMTIEEKISQLMQLSGDFFRVTNAEITGPMADMGLTMDVVENCGSVLGVTGALDVIRIQEEHLKTNRHKIPLLFMADVVHGYKTIFPIPLAIGASFDLELAKLSAIVAAKEAAVSGTHVTFAPMVDLVKDPRWGRVLESTGEDSYLNSCFARAFVEGFQGDDLKNSTDHVAACVKHFAAYGAVEAGRDYNTVDMSERRLREEYLPAYIAGLDAGAKMMMTSFNLVDGIPATGNIWLMRDILREEMNFDGVLISDWGAVKEAISHGTAVDEKEAAFNSIIAGVDIEMMTPCYVNHLEDLIVEDKISLDLLDEAVLRILTLKADLGLFDNPYKGADIEREKQDILSEAHRDATRKVAEASIVLLKNDNNVLPLSLNSSIQLTGPFANTGDILGAWSWKGNHNDSVTLKQGINNLNGLIDNHSETIVVAIGEPTLWSGEARSKAEIKLPEDQLLLLRELKNAHKTVIAVIFNGRPLDLHGVIDVADAVLIAWYPGTEGGNAVANVLYGITNPSAKLPMSFPYSVGQIPIYYNHHNTGRPNVFNAPNEYVTKYLDIPNEPMFPFGFGLSYTEFEYSNLLLDRAELQAGDILKIQITLTNKGKYSGEEIVQLYTRDLVAQVSRPVKELKRFEKVNLGVGETRVVTFTLTEEDLRYFHTDLTFTSDAGDFEVFVGTNSRDVLKNKFRLIK